MNRMSWWVEDVIPDIWPEADYFSCELPFADLLTPSCQHQMDVTQHRIHRTQLGALSQKRSDQLTLLDLS